MTSTPAPFPLEPLGVGESLDAGFRLWRKHFLVFFVLSLVAVAPAQMLNAWYLATNVLAIGEFGNMLVADPNEFLRGSLVFTLIGMLLQAVGWGALMNFGVNRYAGKQMTAGDAARGAVRRFVPFVGLSFIYFLLVGVGFIFVLISVGFALLVIPAAIWLAFKFILAFPAFFAEGLGPSRAMNRGSALSAGRWWQIFALFLVSGIFTSLVTSIVGGLLYSVDLTSSNMVSFFYVSGLINTFLGALFTPLIPSMMIVAYYDGRVRNEGYDIEYMSQQLDLPPPWDPDEQGGGLIL